MKWKPPSERLVCYASRYIDLPKYLILSIKHSTTHLVVKVAHQPLIQVLVTQKKKTVALNFNSSVTGKHLYKYKFKEP